MIKLNKRKAITSISILFIILFCTIGFVKADWVNQNQTYGDWDSIYPNEFAVSGDSSGSVGYLYDAGGGSGVSNFSAVWLHIEKNNFGATLRPFSFSDFKFLNIHFQMVSGLFYDNYIINTNVTNQISWWGLSDETTVNFGGQYSIGTWKEEMDIYIMRDLSTNETWTTRISIWDAGGTTTLPNGTVIDGFNVFWEKEYTGLTGFFNNDLLCALYVEHEGSGYFNFTVTTTFYTDGAQPDIVEGINVPETVETVTDWISGALGFISGGVTFLIELVQVAGNSVVVIAPYLGVILIAYVFDAGITSIYEGSFTPIGNAFTKLYEFVLSVWEKLIQMGMLIWDAITFWT